MGATIESRWCEDELRAATDHAVEAFLSRALHPDGDSLFPGRVGLRSGVADVLPDDGIGIVAAIREYVELVLPASLNVPHPMYLGLLNSSPLPAASLADLLVSTMNNNNGAVHQGPAAAEAEREVLNAFSRLCFGDERASGMILPGGSFANLQALILARAQRFPEWEIRGPTALTRPPTIYVGDSSHLSVGRAARIGGFGQAGVVPIRCAGRGRMDPQALEDTIVTDKARGKIPTAVVATAGTTGTGSIDDLTEVADVCSRHDLWMHVDACYGGAALLLPEMQDRFRGIERADSVAMDPHKWLFVPLTMSVLLVRDQELELGTFASSASYIPNQSDEDGFRRGIATSRRASALTFWAAVRAHGWKTMREGVRRNIALARSLESRFEERGFRVLPDGELSIVCARYEPDEHSVGGLDALQESIRKSVVDAGLAWFATSRHDDKTWLCFRITNLYTSEAHLMELVETVAAHGRMAVSGVRHSHGP